MSATKHTPGPWEYLDIGEIVAGTDHELTLALINEGTVSVSAAETAANANLMAAAPDMFAALQSAVASLEQLVSIDRIPANNKGLREARAALEKAIAP